MVNQENNNIGHRQRLLERFARAGLAGLHDYEIVELLLTYAIPRRDTKPIAKRLLARYKTISALLQAESEELKQETGLGPRTAQLFLLFRELMSYCLSEAHVKQSFVSRRKDAEEYLRFRFGMRKDEFMAVLFLDTGNRVIATEELCEGTVNQCFVHPRTVIERALKRGAAGIILAHNHPGGSVVPSDADWQLTQKIHAVGRLLDVTLHDHLLIVKDKVVSLREMAQWPK